MTTGFERNLVSQRAMLNETWAAFVRNGVTPETELVLEFVYAAPARPKAEHLSLALSDYQTSVRAEGVFRKRWFVDGRSHPVVGLPATDHYVAARNQQHHRLINVVPDRDRFAFQILEHNANLELRGPLHWIPCPQGTSTR